MMCGPALFFAEVALALLMVGLSLAVLAVFIALISAWVRGE
jgi:hypothetical protein